MTSNQINYFKAQEEVRTNMANEEIKRKANQISEGNLFVNQRQADVAERNAYTNSLNAQLRSAELNEAIRSNMAREYENARSNMAREYETQRSNVAHENITSWYNQQAISQNEASLWNKTETLHHQETIDTLRLQEEHRHNVEQEGVQKAGIISKGIEILSKVVPAVLPLFG